MDGARLPRTIGLAAVALFSMFMVSTAQNSTEEGITPGHYSTSRAIVHGSGLGRPHKPVAGQEVRVYLEPLDAASGAEVTDGAALESARAFINITGPEDFSVPFELHGGETLQAVFEYTVVGYYRLQIVLENEALEEDFVAQVLPGPVDVATAWVMSVEHGSTGEELKFKLRFWDSFGNPLSAPDIAGEVNFYGSRVVGRYESRRGGVKEKAIRLGSGLDIVAHSYDALFFGSFAPEMAGEWRLKLVANGQEVSQAGWPPMVLSPGRLDYQGVQIEGMGAAFMKRAGHQYRLAVVPGDVFGNEVVPERPEMGYGCSASITYEGDPRGAAEVEDEVHMKLMFHEIDNVWYLDFLPTRSGTVVAEIRILGEEIHASPLKIWVFPEVADPNTTLVVGECDGGIDTAMAGITNVLTIVARDRYNNSASASADPFGAQLKDISGEIVPGSQVELRSLENGNYTVTYVVPEPGWYSMAVVIGRQPVRGSPFSISAMAQKLGGEAVLKHSIAEVPAVMKAGEDAVVRLLLRDQDCLPAAPPEDNGEPRYFLDLQLPEPPLGENNNSQILPRNTMRLELVLGDAGGIGQPLEATAVATLAGEFAASVVGSLVNGNTTDGETETASVVTFLPPRGTKWPRQVEVVPANATAEMSSITLVHPVAGMEGNATIEAGSTVVVNLTLADAYGNLLDDDKIDEVLSDRLRLVARLLSSSPSEETGVVSNTTGRINVTRAGDIMVLVLLDGKQLGGPGAGIQVLVTPAAAQPGLASFNGNTSVATPFEEAFISVQLRDAFGNAAISPPGLQCFVRVSEAEEEMTGSLLPVELGPPKATWSCSTLQDVRGSASALIQFTLNAANMTFDFVIDFIADNDMYADNYELEVDAEDRPQQAQAGGSLTEDGAPLVLPNSSEAFPGTIARGLALKGPQSGRPDAGPASGASSTDNEGIIPGMSTASGIGLLAGLLCAVIFIPLVAYGFIFHSDDLWRIVQGGKDATPSRQWSFQEDDGLSQRSAWPDSGAGEGATHTGSQALLIPEPDKPDLEVPELKIGSPTWVCGLGSPLPSLVLGGAGSPRKGEPSWAAADRESELALRNLAQELVNLEKGTAGRGRAQVQVDKADGQAPRAETKTSALHVPGKNDEDAARDTSTASDQGASSGIARTWDSEQEPEEMQEQALPSQDVRMDQRNGSGEAEMQEIHSSWSPRPGNEDPPSVRILIDVAVSRGELVALEEDPGNSARSWSASMESLDVAGDGQGKQELDFDESELPGEAAGDAPTFSSLQSSPEKLGGLSSLSGLPQLAAPYSQKMELPILAEPVHKGLEAELVSQDKVQPMAGSHPQREHQAGTPQPLQPPEMDVAPSPQIEAAPHKEEVVRPERHRGADSLPPLLGQQPISRDELRNAMRSLHREMPLVWEGMRRDGLTISPDSSSAAPRLAPLAATAAGASSQRESRSEGQQKAAISRGTAFRERRPRRRAREASPLSVSVDSSAPPAPQNLAATAQIQESPATLITTSTVEAADDPQPATESPQAVAAAAPAAAFEEQAHQDGQGHSSSASVLAGMFGPHPGTAWESQQAVDNSPPEAPPPAAAFVMHAHQRPQPRPANIKPPPPRPQHSVQRPSSTRGSILNSLPGTGLIRSNSTGSSQMRKALPAAPRKPLKKRYLPGAWGADSDDETIPMPSPSTNSPEKEQPSRPVRRGTWG